MSSTNEVVSINAPEGVIPEVYVINAKGEKLPLAQGDTVSLGDKIIAPLGVVVELRAGNGKTFIVEGQDAEAVVEFELTGLSIDGSKDYDETGASLDSVIEKNKGDNSSPESPPNYSSEAGFGFENLPRLLFFTEAPELSLTGLRQNYLDETKDSPYSLPVEDVQLPRSSIKPLLELSPSSDSGEKGDNLTNVPLPEITGVGNPGDIIRGTIGGLPYGPITVPSNGKWSAYPPMDLPDGPALITVEVENPSAVITPGDPLTILIDTTAPVVDMHDIALTNDNTPELTGTVDDPTAAVAVTIDGNTYPAVNNGDGTWTLADNVVAALADGTTTGTVTATDVAGNVGTGTGDVTVDATPPAVPTVELDPAPVNDTGVPGDNRTSNPTPELTGTGTPGDTINLTIGGVPYGPITVPPTGVWTFTPPAPLAEGPNPVTVTIEDPSGNVIPGAL